MLTGSNELLKYFITLGGAVVLCKGAGIKFDSVCAQMLCQGQLFVICLLYTSDAADE